MKTLTVNELTTTEKEWYDFITCTPMRIRKTSAEALAHLTETREENARLKATMTEEQKQALEIVTNMYEVAGTLD